MKELKTERLNLGKLSLDEAPFIYELLNSPGWLKYIGDRGIRTIDDAREYIKNKVLPDYEKPDGAAFAVRLKVSGALVGMCGLYDREGLDGVDIGFAFLPQYAGKGYALEAAKKVLEYAEKTLGIKRVLAITLPENKKSINLLEKIGLQYKKRIFIPNDPEELCLYLIEF